MRLKFRTRKRIISFPSVRPTRSWMKRVKLHRYGGISLYKFFGIFFHNINEDEIFDRSNGVAYNFLLAIFPAMIFLFTLIPYITVYIPDISNESIMQFLGEMMPSSMFTVVSSTILDIVSIQRGGLLTFGFLFAVFLATNGMMGLMRAFNACYRTNEKRNYITTRLTALGLTVMLAVVLTLAILLLVVGQIMIEYFNTHVHLLATLNLDSLQIYSILLVRFVVVFIVFFIAISCIYYFGPAIHYNWNFFSIGSLAATFACMAISYGFSFYIAKFGSYNKVYGSIGTLIALMIWMQLLTIVLMIGYEINASLHSSAKIDAIRHRRRKSRLEKASR
jgi:membrane protein